MNHTCGEQSSTTVDYYVNRCLACVENKRIREMREEFSNMMRVSLDWDSDCVLL